MGEFEIWVYRGIIALLLIVIWWGLTNFSKKIDDNFKSLIGAVKEQSESLIRQEAEVSDLGKRVETNEKQLNDHSTRIRQIENKKA